MALSILDDKSRTPNDEELTEALGRTSRLWNELKKHLASQYEPLTEKWSFSGQKYGWSLGLKRKKRTILYLIPCKRHFLVAFVFGEKAVRAAHESDLPASVVKSIDTATKYVEGRGIRLEVRVRKDLGVIKQLTALKMAN